jgi:hypothetical protein
MQGIIMSLFWFSQGLGALVGLGTIYGFVGVWFTSYDHGNINCDHKNRDHCHLDYYFYLVAGIQVLGMLAFVLASWGLNIGQTVPVRVQRQGYTLVRARENDRPSVDYGVSGQRTESVQEPINRRFSRSD